MMSRKAENPRPIHQQCEMRLNGRSPSEINLRHAELRGSGLSDRLTRATTASCVDAVSSANTKTMRAEVGRYLGLLFENRPPEWTDA
jgi:hypothetical protein